MEAECGDEKSSEFLDQLKNLDARLVLYHRENLYASTSRYWLQTRNTVDYFCNLFQNSLDEQALRRETMLQGIDLDDGVKHYSYSDLSEFTDDIQEEYVFGKTVYGRFLRGKIQQGSGFKDVTIKTWDLFFPPRSCMTRQPARLHNEIMLLMNELKSHPNLPKLIGYSIDKKLAVVYDLKPTKTLRNALKSDDLGWEARVKVAIQVAHLLQHFHSMIITIGSIDSNNIMIDEGDDIKLCEFGLSARLPEMPDLEMPEFPGLMCENLPLRHTAGTYSAPELHALGGTWTVQTDIYAFGYLLLELITKEAFGPRGLYEWGYELLGKGKTSLVHESLLDDADIGSKITKLVMNCMHEDPLQRPKAETVARKLEEDLMVGGVSKKQKVVGT